MGQVSLKNISYHEDVTVVVEQDTSSPKGVVDAVVQVRLTIKKISALIFLKVSMPVKNCVSKIAEMMVHRRDTKEIFS